MSYYYEGIKLGVLVFSRYLSGPVREAADQTPGPRRSARISSRLSERIQAEQAQRPPSSGPPSRASSGIFSPTAIEVGTVPVEMYV